MKQILSALLFLFVAVTACRKNSTQSNEMLGSWKLIQVYDKNTGTQVYPPAFSNIDVVLTFLNRNDFAGHTLRNTISSGTYEQNANGILFKIFSMTNIAEDQWGSSFLTVLMACSLQSTSPCAPSNISVQGPLMFIRTSLRFDITLQKI